MKPHNIEIRNVQVYLSVFFSISQKDLTETSKKLAEKTGQTTNGRTEGEEKEEEEEEKGSNATRQR